MRHPDGMDDHLGATSRRTEVSPVALQLERTAMIELASASAAFYSSDYRTFYVHAGASLELLVKARLCAINPLLLMDARVDSWDKEAKRLLSGLPLAPGEGARTIGAAAAVRRLQTIQPLRSADLAAWCSRVFDARNDVVHAGLAHDDGHESHLRVAAAFFQSVMALRSESDVADQPFSSWPTEELSLGKDFAVFGSAAGLIQELVSQEVNTQAVEARRLVHAAKTRFRKYEADYQEFLMRRAAAHAREEDEGFQLVTSCVACGADAVATGTPELVDLPAYDEEGLPTGDEEPAWILIFDEVRCDACGLVVTGHQLHLMQMSNAARWRDFDRVDTEDW